MKQIGFSGKQFLQQHPNSQSRFASWAASARDELDFAPDCSITHPSIAAPIQLQLQLLATLPCTFFPRKTALWICIHTRFRECGAKLRDAQRQRHAARASRSKTSSIFAQKHISIAPSHSTNFTLPPAPRYWFKPCARSPIQQLGYLYCFDDIEITGKASIGFPTTTRLHRDLLTIPTTNLFI